ncbi:MAG: hypothetical protein DMD81_04565 [Candidatus Rokuibacteriota bacterium]|nr:MAG: hypothetical protein DMD81_04565 [Candidatus Rokubacteria bacterium]
MTLFEVRDPDFEARVRESFDLLTFMRTMGARLVGVAPGEVEVEYRATRRWCVCRGGGLRQRLRQFVALAS